MGAPGDRSADRWWVLAVVCVAVFMLLLDITVVNVALPDIGRSLDANFTDLQWVIDAYALSLAAFLLTAGALADLLGRRLVFTAGLVLFTAASVLCAAAGTPTLLNLARGLQGVGGAAMFATSLALIAQAFHGPERGTAFGIWGATTGAAVAIGPLVGGVVVEHIGWEAIFLVNVPIGVGAVWVTLTRVAESRDPGARGVDWAGLVTFSTALFLLVFALVRGNAEGWRSPLIVGFLAGAGLLLVAFVLVERRQERPMLDLSLFRRPPFVGVSLAAFALSASMFSVFLYLTLYLQNALGYGPLETGLRFLPITILSFVVAPVAGKLSAGCRPRRSSAAGCSSSGPASCSCAASTPPRAGQRCCAGFVVAGAGIGMTNPPLASTAVGLVEPQRSGMASGINNTFRQVGIATGTAGLGALFQQLLENRVTDAFPRAARLPVEAYASGDPGPFARLPGGREAYLGAFTGALNGVLLTAACVALAGAALSLVLIRRPSAPAAQQADSPPAAGAVAAGGR